ncbi:hypothetical protein HY498_01455 [Candidatus Woesearchaeota archaeon]|nr:hypothetical protein [Candidatus Woesearchaeota archaeon]
MKLCKYCKKPGIYDRFLGNVLCDEHRDIYLNLRSVWEAIADIQMENARNRH